MSTSRSKPRGPARALRPRATTPLVHLSGEGATDVMMHPAQQLRLSAHRRADGAAQKLRQRRRVVRLTDIGAPTVVQTPGNRFPHSALRQLRGALMT